MTEDSIGPDSRVFLSGHRGLLGSAVSRSLARAGYDNVSVRTRAELDLTDSDAVSSFLRAERPDCVVHCAAKVGGIQANISDPVGFLARNLLINTNVISAALDEGVRRLIYVGSSCMYPRDYHNPLKEEYILAAPLEPTNEGYALAKIAGAKLCQYCNAQHGTAYKTLIPCNLYGPGDDFSAESSHLIAAITDKLHRAKMARDQTVTIWGDGLARREFLYVEDLADFIVRVLGIMDDLPDFLNVGFGSDFSVFEYYRTAADVIGFEGEFTFDTSKPVGMTTKLLDSTRAREFGWQPATSLREGLTLTYEHYLARSLELVS